MISIKKWLVFFSIICIGMQLSAQDDMLSLLDSVEGKKTHEKVIATFKGGKIIMMQSIQTVKAKTMDFTISHQFGNAGKSSGGGGHQLYGFDNATDIRLGFDFGLAENLSIGVGRSKLHEYLDGLVKYRFLSQTIDNHIPLSIAVYSDIAYSPEAGSKFFAGTESNPDFEQKEIYRFSYATQLLIARKFNSRFSLQLTPTYQHRNYVVAKINPDNGFAETNDLFAMGAGGRFKITKRFAIVADYYYIFSNYRKDNSVTPYYNPLSLGIEIETGGHVFQVNFSNTVGIIENNYIPNTTDSWLKGGFKLGFTISRVFNIVK